MPPLGAWLFLTVLLSALDGLAEPRRVRPGAVDGIALHGAVGTGSDRRLLVSGGARRAMGVSEPAATRYAAALLAAGYVVASLHAWLIAPSWHSRKAWLAYLDYSAKYQPAVILEGLYPSVDAARSATPRRWSACASASSRSPTSSRKPWRRDCGAPTIASIR